MYQKIAVEVTVKDENDNAPVFAHANAQPINGGLITVELMENSAVGGKIEMPQLRASDEDPGLFGDIKYELGPEGEFELVNENFRTYLIPLNELDRESKPDWTGTVIARDGGGREARTRLKVSIIVFKILKQFKDLPVFWKIL